MGNLSSALGYLQADFMLLWMSCSKSQHARTSQALQVVVEGINVVVKILKDQGHCPPSPAIKPQKPDALYSNQELAKLVTDFKCNVYGQWKADKDSGGSPCWESQESQFNQYFSWDGWPHCLYFRTEINQWCSFVRQVNQNKTWEINQ